MMLFGPFPPLYRCPWHLAVSYHEDNLSLVGNDKITLGRWEGFHIEASLRYMMNFRVAQATKGYSVRKPNWNKDQRHPETQTPRRGCLRADSGHLRSLFCVISVGQLGTVLLLVSHIPSRVFAMCSASHHVSLMMWDFFWWRDVLRVFSIDVPLERNHFLKEEARRSALH